MTNQNFDAEEFISYLLEHHSEEEVVEFLENDFAEFLDEGKLANIKNILMEAKAASLKKPTAKAKIANPVKAKAPAKPKPKPAAPKPAPKKPAAKKKAPAKAPPKKKSTVAELVKKSVTKKKAPAAKPAAKKPKEKTATKKTTIALSIERSNTKTAKPKSSTKKAKAPEKKGFVAGLLDKFRAKKDHSERTKKAKQTRDLRKTFGVAPGKVFKNKPIPKGSKRENTLVKSEFEPTGNMISEISKPVLGRYLKKAVGDFAETGEKLSNIEAERDRHGEQTYHKNDAKYAKWLKHTSRYNKRDDGINRAIDRLTGKYHPGKPRKEKPYTAEETVTEDTMDEAKRMSASDPRELTGRYLDHVGGESDAVVYGKGKLRADQHKRAQEIILKHVKKEHGGNSARYMKYAGKTTSNPKFDPSKLDYFANKIVDNSKKKMKDYVPKNAKGKIAEETVTEDTKVAKVKLGQKFTPSSFKKAKEEAMAKRTKALTTVTRPSGEAAKADITPTSDDTNRGARMLKGQYPWGTVSNVMAKTALARLKNIQKPLERLKAMDNIWGSRDHFHSLVKYGHAHMGNGAHDAPVLPKVTLPRVKGVND